MILVSGDLRMVVGVGEGFLFVIWSGGNVSERSAVCLFDFLNWESLIFF